MSTPRQAIYKNTSGAAASRPCILAGVILAGGSAASTVTLYDNTAASGTVVAVLKCAANTSAYANLHGAVCRIGCYVELSGTGAAATVIYE